MIWYQENDKLCSGPACSNQTQNFVMSEKNFKKLFQFWKRIYWIVYVVKILHFVQTNTSSLSKATLPLRHRFQISDTISQINVQEFYLESCYFCPTFTIKKISTGSPRGRGRSCFPLVENKCMGDLIWAPGELRQRLAIVVVITAAFPRRKKSDDDDDEDKDVIRWRRCRVLSAEIIRPYDAD